MLLYIHDLSASERLKFLRRSDDVSDSEKSDQNRPLIMVTVKRKY